MPHVSRPIVEAVSLVDSSRSPNRRMHVKTSKTAVQMAVQIQSCRLVCVMIRLPESRYHSLFDSPQKILDGFNPVPGGPLLSARRGSVRINDDTISFIGVGSSSQVLKESFLLKQTAQPSQHL